jgi:hemolysin activation/secretion protein
MGDTMAARTWKRTAVGIGCMTAMLGTQMVGAATPPTTSPSGSSAGEIQSGIDKDFPAAKSATNPNINAPALPALKESGGLSVDVKQYVISGNTVFADAELEALIASDVGADKNFADLNMAARKISNFYRENGYPVARAYLPQQEVGAEGVIQIAVLEGITGQVNLSGSDSLIDWVGRDYASVLEAGELVNNKDLERAMLLLNDLPGVDAHASLKAGQSQGASDIDIRVDAQQQTTGYLSLNNYGTEYNGKYRVTGGVQFANLAGIGDALTANLLVSDSGDTLLGGIGYSFPVGPYGTRLAFNYSHVESEVGEELKEFGIESEADIFSVSATHPFVRSRQYNLIGQAALTFKDLEETWGAEYVALDDTLGSEEELTVLSFGVSGDSRDTFASGGINTYSLNVDVASLDFDSVTASRIDAEDTFVKLNYSLSRLQRYSDRTSLFVHLRGQQTADRLVTSEQMGLGGPTGVRAYASSEALGDKATLLTLEARYQVKPFAKPMQSAVVYGFLDAGISEVNDPLAGTNEDSDLSGAGMGLKLGFRDDYYLDMNFAVGFGSDTATAGDDDNHVWLQLVKQFN